MSPGTVVTELLFLMFHNYIDLDEMHIEKRFPVCIPTDAPHQGLSKYPEAFPVWNEKFHWGQTHISNIPPTCTSSTWKHHRMFTEALSTQGLLNCP